jgi:gliding-associated putative ABC transporter substrate-binding component GldG
MKIAPINRQQTVLRTLVALAIIVFVNLAGLRLFKRLDLTQDKLYTLSDASKNLARSLDDKFIVKAYFSTELPPEYMNNRRYLKDQLDEYHAYAGGNFQYEFIDPGKDKETEQAAQRYGIPPVQIQVLKQDKYQVEMAYMGLVFLYGDKQEHLPVVQSTSNLEYEISSAIKKLTSKELKKVGFLTGHGEPSLQPMARLNEMLSKQYAVTTVDLTGGKAVPPDVSVLLVVAPDKPFKDWEKFLIDQYLMKGGRIAFLLNKVNATLQSQRAMPLNLNLDDMLESYGVRVNTDLVRDVSCAYVTVSQQAGFMTLQNQVPFYYLPSATDFDRTSPIVKDLRSVTLYFASSIDTSLARARGVTARVLLKSSNRSGRAENVFLIDPRMEATPEMFKETGIPLAVTVEGAFKSAFAGKPVPLDSSVRHSIDTTGRFIAGKASKIVIMGDGDFLQDQLSGGNRDNFNFASNLVDWLADDIGLASIRARDSGSKPLDEVGEGTKTIVKTVNLAAPPLLVIFAGVVRWRMRISRRKRLETRGI